MLLKSFLKQAIIPLSFVIVNQSNVMALDILGQLRQYNPPYNIPDVIIDSNPSPSTSPIPQPTAPNPTSTNTTNTSNSNDPRFTCQFVNGQYTVMYHPESNPNQQYPWAIPGKMGGGWTPERRCTEISNRLEAYRPDGLVGLNTGRQNNQNILCVTTDVDSRCRIVLTVPPNQNPEVTRNLVFENLLVADDGTQTYGVNTFTNRNPSSVTHQIGNILNPNGRNNSNFVSPKTINLKPFLAPSDGGTGTNIKNSSPKPTTKSSHPKIFN